jgi:DUF917 family protein
MLRTTCIELGLMTSVVARPLTGKVIKEFVIPNTVSQSWYLGRAEHMARKFKTDFIKAIACHLSEVGALLMWTV